MKYHYYSTCLLVILALVCSSNAFDLTSMLSPKRRKTAQKLSEEMNDFIKGTNEIAGEEVITPLEDREGMGRMFFTATPSPSVSPTPSTTPSPSITPTPSVSPSMSATPSYSPSPTTTPTVSRTPTPSPTPTKSPPKNNNSNSKPTPTPSSSSAPAVEVINRSTDVETVPTDGSEIEVAVDFSGSNVSEGQIATVSSIQAAGDLPNVTGRMLLLGSARQAQNLAAYLLITFSDGSNLRAFPDNSCSQGIGPVSFSQVGATIQSAGNQLSVSLRIQAVGFGSGCGVQIQVSVTVETPVDTTTPAPVPSN